MRNRVRHVAIPAAILGVGLVGVGVLFATRPEPEHRAPEIPAPLVSVVVAEPTTVDFVVRAQGTVVPRTESALVPQVSGEVIWVSPGLVSGGFFDRGDALVRIDRLDSEADLESARAALARAQSEFRRAGKERDRQRGLAHRSAASQARIDDAENGYRVAEAVVREAAARLGRAERDLERTTLRAPYDGRVRSKDVDVGQFVSRGQLIATLYAVDYAEVRLPLPDRELRYLDLPLLGRRSGPIDPPGRAAATDPDRDGAATDPDEAVADVDAAVVEPSGPGVTLRAEFAGGQYEWRGRIVRTEGEIDARSRMVTVVARVEDPYGRLSNERGAPLAVGLFVAAEIQGRRAEGAYVLPRSALRLARGEEGDRVYVIDADDRLQIRPIDLLRAERESIVVGAGLAPGDRVAVSALRGAVAGMRVRVSSEPAADVAGGTASFAAVSARSRRAAVDPAR